MTEILFLSIISGCAYRLGGSGKVNTKVRDVGCMLCALLCMHIAGVRGAWWMWTLSGAGTFGALTTYHKWLNKIFGGASDTVYWYGWLAHGFIAGLACFWFYPIMLTVLARALVLGVFTMIWSESQGNDVVEEFGRGFLLCATTLIFLLA